MNRLKIFLFCLIIVFSLSWGATSLAQSEAARQDESVTNEDLRVNQARILPDNPLYALKRIGRNVRRALAFGQAKKVEYDIQDTNQELADLTRLLDEKGEKVSDAVLKGFERVDKRFARIAEQAPGLAKEDAVTRNNVVEHLVDSEMKRQKLFAYIESKTDDERVLERVLEIRNRMIERVGDVLEDVKTDEDLFDRVLKNQTGSEFKDLRNLEVLKRIEDQVPEQARGAIQKAQENAFKRLQEHVGQFKNDEEWTRLNAYMHDFGGDQVVRFELLDKFEDNFVGNEIPDQARANIKDARDFSARAFQDKFEKMENIVQDETRLSRIRENMMDRFQVKEGSEKKEFQIGLMDDMSDRFEMMAKFKSNIQSERLEKEMDIVEGKQIDLFVQAFPDAEKDAERAKQVISEIRIAAADGDFKKVKLLEKVVGEIKEKTMGDPQKRSLVEQMEVAQSMAEQGFVEHLRQGTAGSFDAVVSDDPSHVQFLQKLKVEFAAHPEDFGGNAGEGNEIFDRAIDKQVKHFTQEDARQKGLIPVPEGVDQSPNSGSKPGTSDLERKGLIPVPEGFDPGPVGLDGRSIKDTAPGGNPLPQPAPKKVLKLAPKSAPKPVSKPVEKSAPDSGSKPGTSELEKKGLIPVPEGFDPGPVGSTGPGSDLEKRGLIPVPEGVDQSPNSGSKPGTSDLERKGLIPVPEGFDPGPVGLDGRSIKDTAPGGNPLPQPAPQPSPSPRSGGSDLEQKGLIPVPIGDTAPGGNVGPSPAPVLSQPSSGVDNTKTRAVIPAPKGFDPGPVGRSSPLSR
ncbi:MAG: hypothetical protein A2821_01675 [Candidatus Magasanikbacteria bacterium RIFCSPHIGHO2_01_FULL_41_23]|nr:MAG: hypothetical protein A2821_01675 [Candidatus Magasanikbacteria bacterium RIFCSPHIGHO2_01_FULL_41_23]OGH76653.1 MAG: hypothetical protein A3F22_00945 [Candidatus Magasanikbacteria bacterium RIFCSPHIGHO2_12_FULL_41_16]